MDRMSLARLTGWAELALALALLGVVALQFASYFGRDAGAANPPFYPVLLAGGLVWLLSGLRNWLLADEVARLNETGGGRSPLLGFSRRSTSPEVLARSGKGAVALGILFLALAALNA